MKIESYFSFTPDTKMRPSCFHDIRAAQSHICWKNSLEYALNNKIAHKTSNDSAYFLAIAIKNKFEHKAPLTQNGRNIVGGMWTVLTLGWDHYYCDGSHSGQVDCYYPQWRHTALTRDRLIAG